MLEMQDTVQTIYLVEASTAQRSAASTCSLLVVPI